MEKALNKRATTFRTECTKGLRWNYYNLGGGHHRAEEWSWDCWYWYPSSWKEARQIWEHRPLRRGQLCAGVNVFDGWHDTATSANTGKTVSWIQLLWCCWGEELLGWCSLKLQVQKKFSGGESEPASPPLALSSPTGSHCYQSPVQSVGKVKCHLQSPAPASPKRYKRVGLVQR